MTNKCGSLGVTESTPDAKPVLIDNRRTDNTATAARPASDHDSAMVLRRNRGRA